MQLSPWRAMSPMVLNGSSRSMASIVGAAACPESVAFTVKRPRLRYPGALRVPGRRLTESAD